jgi:hypothetical protein
MRLLSISLALTLLSLAVVRGQSPAGHVKGEVWYRPFVERENLFDTVRLSGCEIVFRSMNLQKKVVADGEGLFDADLPAGHYEATTDCTKTPDGSEYYSALRSDFEVKAGSSSLINLMVILKHSGKTPDSRNAGEEEYRSGEPGKESLEARTKANQSRKILVRYIRRLSSKDLAEYQGKRDYRQDAPASLSYDMLAIYADSITIEKPALHVRAVGHVVVEDGMQRRLANEATVEFDAADPASTLKLLGAANR